MAPFSRGLSRVVLRHRFRQSLRRTFSGVVMGREKFFRVSEEIEDALATGKPVVALETTIYTHGKCKSSVHSIPH